MAFEPRMDPEEAAVVACAIGLGLAVVLFALIFG